MKITITLLLFTIVVYSSSFVIDNHQPGVIFSKAALGKKLFSEKILSKD
jgi:hypothetical protein